ncbi:Lrp/AsnC family transcriptional regulator [Tsukamurella soli]|uniref:Lrp/AsnC family transcriptional regulator n=1 Tax=Tsukamurella soli TaxID=644556 RepID=A0ABP8JNC4_9ACTN
MTSQNSDPLDDLDRSILRELESDGRRAFRQIARNVRSSEATVRARVKRMQDLDILRIVAFADPERLGDAQLALVLLRVDPRRHRDVVAALVALPQVTYVSTLMGRADICAEVRSADNHDLWEFLNTKVSAIEGVRDTETITVLSVHKLRYDQGAGLLGS